MNRGQHTRYGAALATAAVLLLGACDSGFEEMNTNPTQASELSPEYLFTTAEVGMTGTGYMQWRNNLIYPAAMMQQMSATWWAGDKYTESEQWMTALWGVYYGQFGKYRAVIPTLQDLIVTHQDDPTMVNKVAAARILRAYAFHRLTDTYGDIPYFEAGRGYLDGIVQPVYDPQSEIYADMLKELQEAVGSFDPAQPTFGNADLLYGGDIDRWKKFGNSLMLRLALRLVKVDPGMAQQWAQTAISGGVMSSVDDSAVLPHEAGPSGAFDGLNVNPISSTIPGNGANSPALLVDTFVDWMQDHGDPRLRVFGATYDDAVFLATANLVTDDPAAQVGWPVGNDAATVQTEPSWNATEGIHGYTQPSRLIIDLDDPTFYMTYAQVALNVAEAAARWGIGGDPAARYEEGVRAAMQQLSLYDDDGAADIPAGEIDAYLAANPYNPANALEQINTQYWAASFLDMEVWFNWRRTGFPVLDPVEWPTSPLSGTIPRRMQYPQDEAALNPENYAAANDRQGPNEMTTRVWWDVAE